MPAHPPARFHGPLTEIFDDVFLVQGTVPVGPGMTIGRNMIVLREARELTLVDPIRLDDATEKQLLALGEVRHLIRLGHAHGSDIPYSAARFGARYWALPGEADDLGVPFETLDAGSLPCPGELFVFEHATLPEGALRLPHDGGLVVLCDALQDVREGIPYCSFLARLTMPLLGFRKALLVGPIWLKNRRGDDPSGLRGDFERLVEPAFDHLVGAHGGIYRGGAREAARAAVERAFR